MFSGLRALVGGCAFLAFLLLPSLVQGQGVPQAFAQGTVVDSAKAPLAQVQVLVVDSTSRVVAKARTDSSGEFVLGGLAPNTSYFFSMRKLGFVIGTLKLATPKAGDTLWVDAMLQAGPPALNTVKVNANANAAYHIDAAEIAKEPVVNALDVVMKYRPRMLGDAYKECRPDTSHLGPPLPPTMPTFGMNNNSGNGTSRGRRSSVPAAIQSSTYFDTSLAAHGYPPPPQLSNPDDTLGKTPAVLYINGVLRTLPGIKNILADIPAEDISEMHYIDCWDTKYPTEMRNALYILLKPGKSY